MPKIECNVIKVLKQYDRKGGRDELRIVQWAVDGKNSKTMLEKRSFIDTDKGLQTGKAKGMTVQEIMLIVQNSADIVDIMEGTIKDFNVEDPAPPEPEKTPF